MDNINFQYGIFKFESEEEREFNELRTIKTEDGEILFCGIDAAKMIGYKRPSDAISQHCKHTVKCRVPCNSGSYTDNKGKEVNIIKEMDLLFIPESDLYRLAFKSQLPKAEKFTDWVVEEVLPSIRKKGYYGEIDRRSPSNFILRYDLNFGRIDPGYFSVISELYTRLFVKFHVIGYDIPDKAFDGTQIRPDVSVGRMFPKFLEKYYPEHKDKFISYKHSFGEGIKDRDAKQYENCVWEAFINYVDNVWIPQEAQRYFKERDTKALDYLPKLIEIVKPTTPKGLLKKKELDKSKENTPNDDFDKGIDTILGFNLDED